MPDPVRISMVPGRDLTALIAHAKVNYGPEGFRRMAFASFTRDAPIIAGRISTSVRQGRFGLQVRTGALARSIAGVADEVDGQPAIRVGILKQGGAAVYAGVQELGTKGKEPDSPYPTIRPKRGKALAIPVGPALTNAGVARENNGQPVSPRNYPRPLRFIPVNRGRTVGVLVDTNTKAASERNRRRAKADAGGFVIKDTIGPDSFHGVVAFVLVRSVDIRAKHYLLNGLNRELPFALGRLGAKLAAGIAGPGGGAGAP